MNRRVESNHALAYAVEVANGLKSARAFLRGADLFVSPCERPLPYLSTGGRAGDGAAFSRRWASATCSICGGAARTRTTRSTNLTADAAAVVTDDYPVFVARDHNRSVPAEVDDPVLRRGFQLHRADGALR